MLKRLLFACSALVLASLALGSTPANACGGYYGYGYGYGYGGCGCGYAYYARPAYYVRPAFAYYAPYYRGWGYAPRFSYGWRGVGWRRW
jgi:hypothetical protein